MTTSTAAPDPGTRPPLTDLVAGLRGAWRAAALTVTGAPELAALLEQRLTDLEAWGTLDQSALAEVLDEAAGHLRAVGLDAAATALTRRLLRSVYEFLLAVDARVQLAAEHAVVRLDAAPPPPDPPASRRLENLDQVQALLRRGALGDVAALLHEHADSGGGPALIPLAIEAGDHCRDAGMTRAAGDCYLAAWSSDRHDDRALWRLAELGVITGDIDLAVSYLDCVLAVLRWRGDTRGVARVYRKMAILAPDRDDIRQMMRRVGNEVVT